MISGHEKVREELEENLPPITLLLGPQSVGKRTLALHLALAHTAAPFYYPLLTAAIARDIVSRVPLRGGGTAVYVIALDGSTPTAQNILLKTLEEPPGHARFILIASSPPLPTITSRARACRLGLLTDAQVSAILQDSCGVAPADADRVAAAARGRVAPALAAASRSEDNRVRSGVAAVLKAARDGSGLELVLRSWTPGHTDVLQAWASEAASGRWNRFAESFAPGVTGEQARGVLRALAVRSRSRDAAAVALAAAFREA